MTEPTYITRNPTHFQNLLDFCLTSVPHSMRADAEKLVEALLSTSDHALVSTFPPPTFNPILRRIWHFEKMYKYFRGLSWRIFQPL